MKKTLRASVFVLALCCPAFAGDIPCPTVAPTPQPAYAVDSEIQSPQTVDGDAPNGATATFVEIMLNLLTLL
jgi:hypothetical protein